ncbi:Adenosine 5'-monophosphoramidase [Coelomomyces lativittatus]|nr:Adenosine 5'-monophosphoramidase [Coelomomyces lativittatus]KAJ1505727.1 Adenosine 5'-monophosphoramidase [Coelomomyces lativittatus]KAJ1517546.1 Adenosine 5'-monophosphoramidase [Coelomomyces lativittatus]
MTSGSATSCIFCRIIKKEIPCFKLFESDKVLGFLDVGPLSKGHALVIPKEHKEFLHEVSNDALSELLPAAKQVANLVSKVTGVKDYNILQNNGRLAHQVVPHVHFHVIPKTTTHGLTMEWETMSTDMDALKKFHEELKVHLHSVL